MHTLHRLFSNLRSLAQEVESCRSSWIPARGRGCVTTSLRIYNFTDCPQPVDPLLIVLPVSGGVMVIGILGLVAWRLITNHRDKIRFKAFLDDVKSSKWAAVRFMKFFVGKDGCMLIG